MLGVGLQGDLVRGGLRLRGVVVEDPRRRVRRVRVLVVGGRLLLGREVVLRTRLMKLCHFLQHKAPCCSLYDCFPLHFNYQMASFNI